MEQPLVSIVIPVYNAAPDLARCIESVRKQTYRNIEVFLVNDGSKDASSPICHMYERIDPRVHVIDKENAGVSAARNTGIAAAQGKYIQFVDSDDYLAPGATATLIERAEHAGADMVIAHYYRVDGGKTTRHGFLKRRDVMDQREFARELMDEPASFYYGVLWNKLYRADIIRGKRRSAAGRSSLERGFPVQLGIYPLCPPLLRGGYPGVLLRQKRKKHHSYTNRPCRRGENQGQAVHLL